MQVSYGNRCHPPEHSLATTALGPLPLPPLGAQSSERLPLQPQRYRQGARFHLWQDRQLTLGIASAPLADQDLGQCAESLYDELFALTGDAYLYRIWNYLPEINAGQGDQENYRRFCVGRSQSFHRAFGVNETSYMPAGTCVGCDGEHLTVLFLSAPTRPDHHENPKQIPAYRYPRQYGPTPPSFARATTGAINGARHRYISGTAAVLGHQSQARGDLAGQIAITCDHLETVDAQTRAGHPQAAVSSFLSGKVYLRHAAHYEEAKALLEQRFPQYAAQLVYLRSDICRQDLLVEIELAFVDPLKAS